MLRNEPEQNPNDGGYEDISDYMRIKRAKLQEQNVQLYGSGKSQLFRDIKVHVNGRTDPPAETLRELIVSHGGVYEQYYRPSRVTHMIATQLPPSKWQHISKQTVVVRPEWISDSIAVGKLIDPGLYRPGAEESHIDEEMDVEECDKDELISDEEISADNRAGREVDCNARDFIAKYYKASRLHHLSSWREDLKVYAALLMEGKKQSAATTVLHVDLDCFFASVALREHPELVDKPVGVAHHTGNSEESGSDLASCNYVARAAGIRNGMYVGMAKQLCPDLVILPYQFEQYHEVSQQLYRILAQHAARLLAVSCDEAYLQPCEGVDPLDVAMSIRQQIIEQCRVPASVGVGSNRLMARLATKRAKPSNIFWLKEQEAASFLASLPIRELPGVGHVTAERLASLGMVTCSDLKLEVLVSELGPTRGPQLMDHARGIDHRSLNDEAKKTRRSVGCDINWAIRFSDNEQAFHFIDRLAEEAAKRLSSLGLKASRVNLKILRRKLEAPPPHKYMGCGQCDSFSRSKSCPTSSSASDFALIAKSLFISLSIPPSEVRGVGIFLADLKPQGHQTRDIRSMFHSMGPREGSMDSIQRLLSRGGFSKEIFDELPKEIQQELLNEFESEPFPQKKQTQARTRGPNLFSFWKKRPNIVSSQGFHPTNIDLEVFDQLPEEIQQEILNEYVTDLQLVETKIEVKDLPVPFKSNHSLDQLREWLITRKNSLSQSETAELGSYLECLVESKIALEPVTAILTLFKDEALFPNGRYYDELIERIQNRIKEVYGANLKMI